MKRRDAFVAAIVIALFPPAQESPLRAGPPWATERAAASALVVVPNCRVKLVDEVQLAIERTGILDQVAEEGSSVRAGDTVGHVRDHLIRAGLAIVEREAENDVEVRFARKACDLAQLKYVRALEANKTVHGTVSELELGELRLAAEKALLQLEQAEHHFAISGLKRDEMRATLKSCRIAAPFDALVLDVYKKPGEVVRDGEPILRIANSRRVRVEGYLEIEQAARLRRGNRVQARMTGDESSSGAAPSGRLAFIDLKVEPVSQKVRVWAEIANEQGMLRDGVSATLVVDPQRIEPDLSAIDSTEARRPAGLPGR